MNNTYEATLTLAKSAYPAFGGICTDSPSPTEYKNSLSPPLHHPIYPTWTADKSHAISPHEIPSMSSSNGSSRSMVKATSDFMRYEDTDDIDQEKSMRATEIPMFPFIGRREKVIGDSKPFSLKPRPRTSRTDHYAMACTVRSDMQSVSFLTINNGSDRSSSIDATSGRYKFFAEDELLQSRLMGLEFSSLLVKSDLDPVIKRNSFTALSA